MIKDDVIQLALQDACIHIMPIGGKEPHHIADGECWCHPLEKDWKVFWHNASDCREAYERIHKSTRTPDEKWISVRSKS